MKKFLELISEEMGKGFEAAGYEAQLGRVTVSNVPICANISVTARWRAQKNTIKPRS